MLLRISELYTYFYLFARISHSWSILYRVNTILEEKKEDEEPMDTTAAETPAAPAADETPAAADAPSAETPAAEPAAADAEPAKSE